MMIDRFPPGDYDDLDTEPVRVKAYTFTPAQLYRLLTETVDLYTEHIEVHGDTPETAKHESAIGTAEGLDEEQAMCDRGELRRDQMTQVYTPND